MLEQPGFGKRLRQLRQQRGISQVSLSGTGMSAAYLSRLESGARRPTDRAVAYLAAQLSIPADTFEKDRPEDSLAEVVALVAASPERDLDAGMGAVLAESLRTAGEADDLTRWHALVQLARVHEKLGKFRAEREVLAELNGLGEKLGRAALLGRARLRLAFCERDLGHLEAARDAGRRRRRTEHAHLRGGLRPRAAAAGLLPGRAGRPRRGRPAGGRRPQVAAGCHRRLGCPGVLERGDHRRPAVQRRACRGVPGPGLGRPRQPGRPHPPDAAAAGGRVPLPRG
ncbi:helix-turn-helix domain-containing protein [Streptomyces sp. NPDC058612]|uniref:helix-turn-helix domain-containing protein n=1 Tax=Streptomyces sp. NPDC058612 TaxID=3346555 RepID=UPI0036638672